MTVSVTATRPGYAAGTASRSLGVDLVAPSVTALALGSPADTDGYAIGETITVTATFGESVTVVGAPTLPLTVGTAAKSAAASAGSGTTIAFVYTVAAGDEDTDGVSVVATGTLTVSSGNSIADAAGNPAGTALPTLTAATGQKVDGVAPTATYTAPGTLTVGVEITTITAGSPSSDTESYGLQTGTLPAGLSLNTSTGAITGTPTTASTATAAVAVRLTDDVGNTGDVSLTFPAVGKGTQDLSGFSYSPSTITFGDTTPTLTAPTVLESAALSYTSQTTSVCTMVSGTGVLTIVTSGTCTIQVSAAATTNYNAGTATADVTVNVAGTVSVAIDADIAGDDVVNISEKGAGFTISGTMDTGATVRLTIGSGSARAPTVSSGTWSVSVGADDGDITGTSVTVSVTATQAGSTGTASRSLGVDLVAPGVTALALGSPADTDGYAIGETITVTATFGESVTVVGAPTLPLTVGSTAKSAAASAGSGTAIAFEYTVAAGDEDTDGVSVVASGTLTVSSGNSIADAAGNPAGTDLPTLSAATGQEVDGVAPTATYTAPGTLTVGVVITTITAGSASSDTVGYALQTGTLPAGLSLNTSTGAITGTPTTASTATAAVTVRLTDNVGNTGDVSLTFPAVVTATTPRVILTLTPASIEENGGVSEVTATLSEPSDTATMITVAAAAVTPAVAGDFTLSGTTLIVDAGATESTGQVTITAVDNDVDAADKTVNVTGTVDNSGVTAPHPVVLTITDDDEGEEAPNGPPIFNTAATFSVMENTQAVGTVTATDSDAEDDVTGYALVGGVDLLQFDITNEGVVFFRVAPDFENPIDAASANPANAVDNNEYIVVVRATSGTAGRLMTTDQTITVTVTDAADDTIVAPPIDPTETTTIVTTPDPGTTTVTYTAAKEVTVTVGSDVPPGVVVEMPPVAEIPDGGLKIALRALPESETTTIVTDEDRKTYEFGTDVVDVSIEELAAGPAGMLARLCLPVPPELMNSGKPLVLLHYTEGEWRTEGSAGAGGEQVCVDGLTSGSPFVVAALNPAVNTAPTFDELRYTFALEENHDGTQTPVLLGTVTATDGDGDMLSYGLAAGDASRFAIDENTGEISYVGGGEDAEASYGLTASVTDGKETVTVPVTVTVVSTSAEIAQRARLKRVNEAILPQLSRAMAADIVDNIANRIGQAMTETEAGGTSQLAETTAADFLWAHKRALEEGTLEWERVLGGLSLTLPLSKLNDSALAGGASGAPGGGVVLWGKGGYQSLSGGDSDSAVEWDGNVTSFHIGADTRLASEFFAGMALSWQAGRMDYKDRGESSLERAGEWKSQMTSAHPYFAWLLDEGSEVWATVGYGTGEVSIDDEEIGTALRSDSTLRMAGAGGSLRLLSRKGYTADDTVTLRVKGAAWLTRFDVEGSGSLLEEVSADTGVLRFRVEGGYTIALASGGWFRPSTEVGVRYDWGDGETGTGVELGGGLEYMTPTSGLAMEVRGRALATHSGDTREWGVSGTVRLAPGADGLGMSFSVVPSWGTTDSGMDPLWAQGMTGLGVDADDAPAMRLKTELGYGLPVAGRTGVLTPYGGFGFSEGAERSYRLGVRLKVGSLLQLSAEGERRERPRGPEYLGTLRAEIRW